MKEHTNTSRSHTPKNLLIVLDWLAIFVIIMASIFIQPTLAASLAVAVIICFFLMMFILFLLLCCNFTSKIIENLYDSHVDSLTSIIEHKDTIINEQDAIINNLRDKK